MPIAKPYQCPEPGCGVKFVRADEEEETQLQAQQQQQVHVQELWEEILHPQYKVQPG